MVHLIRIQTIPAIHYFIQYRNSEVWGGGVMLDRGFVGVGMGGGGGWGRVKL